MTTLNEKLMADLKQAMKDKDKIRKDVIGLIRAGFQNEAIKLGKKELEKDEQIAIVKRELKQTKDAMQEAKSVGREDIVELELQKIAVIEDYLPKQLTEDEIKELVKSYGVEQAKNAGQAIGMAMKQINADEDLKASVEGALVSKVIQELFA